MRLVDVVIVTFQTLSKGMTLTKAQLAVIWAPQYSTPEIYRQDLVGLSPTREKRKRDVFAVVHF